MKALVTGARGFVGRRVVAALRGNGVDVVTTARRECDLSCDLLTGDLRALVRDAGCDVLVHLAWAVDTPDYWSSTDNLRWAARSIELVHAFVDAGGTRVVGVGTCAEYDWSGERVRCIEGTTPLRPATLYGACKGAVGTAVVGASTIPGVTSAWCRLFHLYGPGERRGRLVADAAATVVAGGTFEISAGASRRDYLYVEDAGSAIAAAALSSFSGAMNVASGATIAVADLARAIARHAGRPDSITIGSSTARAGEPVELAADVTTLRSVIGFQPAWSVEDGARVVVEEARARSA